MKIVTKLYVLVSGLLEAESDRSVPALKVDDAAPDFTLPGSDGKEAKLSSFKGKRNVVLAFFTEALSGG